MTSNAEAPALHPAVQVLRNFFDEMNIWEWERLRESKEASVRLGSLTEPEIIAALQKMNDAARASLAAIFDRYCEAGAKAKRIRDVIHYGGEEPDYNSEKEEVLSVEERGDTVVVETKMTHQLRNRLKYELVKRGDSWKIRDNRKFFSEFHKKWHRMDL